MFELHYMRNLYQARKTITCKMQLEAKLKRSGKTHLLHLLPGKLRANYTEFLFENEIEVALCKTRFRTKAFRCLSSPLNLEFQKRKRILVP